MDRSQDRVSGMSVFLQLETSTANRSLWKSFIIFLGQILRSGISGPKGMDVFLKLSISTAFRKAGPVGGAGGVLSPLFPRSCPRWANAWALSLLGTAFSPCRFPGPVGGCPSASPAALWSDGFQEKALFLLSLPTEPRQGQGQRGGLDPCAGGPGAAGLGFQGPAAPGKV